MSTLLRIECADKANHHEDKLNPGIMPAFPSRVCFCGRSNVGKGSTAKTLIMSAVPAYDNIVVLHYDPSTLEWDDCDPVIFAWRYAENNLCSLTAHARRSRSIQIELALSSEA